MSAPYVYHMLTDPICALATVPGRSALAVVRLSGRGVIAMADRLVHRRSPAEGNGSLAAATLPPRKPTLAHLADEDGQLIDQALVTVFPGPGSYTGEDLVEFSCHGGLVAPARLLAALQALGARMAAPGEFTRRAVLNGKLDLLQAEAVGDLIDATTRIQAVGALHQMEGGLSQRIHRLREALLEALALQSYDIDFPEEDDGPLDRHRVRAALEAAQSGMTRLLETAPLGERLRQGALIVLAGRPNAGKSSLFNALLGTDRALVTEIPGTTRDTIEAASEIDGWPIRLADTAGLREASDRVERLGVEVSRKYLEAADLVLFCVEGSRELDPEELAVVRRRPAIVIRTKTDLHPAPDISASGAVSVSVVTGQGLEALKARMAELLFAGGETGVSLEPMLSRERHRHALARARSEIDDALLNLDEGEPVLAAHHVRQSILALEELIGVVDVDEVLGAVFERFCVGK